MRKIDQDTEFRLLRHLEKAPASSQRELASTVGISLGAVNFCLKALVEKGHIKARNFRASDNKLRYAYVLTPNGIATKAALTGNFLKRKLAEYERLKSEIESLQVEISDDHKPSDQKSGTHFWE